MSKTQVLLAHNDTQVLADLRQKIDHLAHFQVVAEASNGHDVIHLTRQLNPGIVLIDIHMLGLNGLSTMTQITQKSPAIKVIVLSISTKKNYALEAFKAGATGYISQSTFSTELEKALHSIAKGERWFNSVVARLIRQYDPNQPPFNLFSSPRSQTT